MITAKLDYRTLDVTLIDPDSRLEGMRGAILTLVDSAPEHFIGDGPLRQSIDTLQIEVVNEPRHQHITLPVFVALATFPKLTAYLEAMPRDPRPVKLNSARRQARETRQTVRELERAIASVCQEMVDDHWDLRTDIKELRGWLGSHLLSEATAFSLVNFHLQSLADTTSAQEVTEAWEGFVGDISSAYYQVADYCFE